MNGWAIYLICHVVMMLASVAICAFVSRVKRTNINKYELAYFIFLSIFLAPVTFTIYLLIGLFVLIRGTKK